MEYFRSLSFKINYSKFFYVYPNRFDNDIFILKLAMFIENDLKTNSYLNLNPFNNRFYVDMIDGSIIFVDKLMFRFKEKYYLKNKNNWKVDETVEENKMKEFSGLEYV